MLASKHRISLPYVRAPDRQQKGRIDCEKERIDADKNVLRMLRLLPQQAPNARHIEFMRRIEVQYYMCIYLPVFYLQYV